VGGRLRVRQPGQREDRFQRQPKTWPNGEWPAQDASGKPIIRSNQDSYCVYNDSNNARGVLGIQVNQIGYAFSQKKVRT